MKTFNQAGLTLLEIIVVILALFILVVALIPMRDHTTEAARRKTCAWQLCTIQMAISSYEVDYSMFPAVAKGPSTFTEKPQDALNLLYREYISDLRVFSCPSNRMSLARMNVIKPSSDVGYSGGLLSSYGYSPGHNSTNGRVIILADRKGSSPNSDNHGKNNGQNEMTAGGSVSFIPAQSDGSARGNRVSQDKDATMIFDPDIFTYGDLKAYPDWDSGCQ